MAKNVFLPDIGETTSVVASGSALLGDRRDDTLNSKSFILVHNAGTASIGDGVLVVAKNAVDRRYVVTTAAASGIGEIAIGFSRVDAAAATGTSFWAQTEGVHTNVLHADTALVAGDRLMGGPSGAVVELGVSVALGKTPVCVGYALEADIYTLGTAASGGLEVLIGPL